MGDSSKTKKRQFTPAGKRARNRGILNNNAKRARRTGRIRSSR